MADKIDIIKTVKVLEHKMWSNEDIEAYEKRLYHYATSESIFEPAEGHIF